MPAPLGGQGNNENSNILSRSLSNNIDITIDSSDISVNSDYLPHSNYNLLDNTYKEDDDNVPKPIEVVIGNRYEGWKDKGSMHAGWNTNNTTTVRRDNKRILASKLPTIFVTNHRSFFPKFHNFVNVMKTLDLTLCLHSEVWEDKEKKTRQDKLEEALELDGIQYISNPRPDRRGGGAAISLMAGEFTLTKLDVIVPKKP